MKQRIIFQVDFGKHIDLERVAGMRTNLAIGGNVLEGEDNRSFFVETFPETRRAYFKKTLLAWELHGFLRWREVSEAEYKQRLAQERTKNKP